MYYPAKQLELFGADVPWLCPFNYGISFPSALCTQSDSEASLVNEGELGRIFGTPGGQCSQIDADTPTVGPTSKSPIDEPSAFPTTPPLTITDLPSTVPTQIIFSMLPTARPTTMPTILIAPAASSANTHLFSNPRYLMAVASIMLGALIS
jgi:hypothetical protein